MSITDELREYIGRYAVAGSKKDKTLTAIADRIDTEHERVRAESIIDMTDESMAEHGWIRLPVDADGEYIHIGDRLDEGTVERIVLTNGDWEPYVLVYDSNPHILHEHFCHEVSHYRPPTLEDMLREFGRGWYEQMNGPETFDIADYVERYAVKVREVLA